MLATVQNDVPIPVAARLLEPLGNPAANAVKFYAASELLELVKDRAWLVKVTNAVNQHWHKQNACKRGRPVESVACKLLVGDKKV